MEDLNQGVLKEPISEARRYVKNARSTLRARVGSGPELCRPHWSCTAAAWIKGQHYCPSALCLSLCPLTLPF